MSDKSKLPVSLQLVGLTAAIVFCFGAAAVFAYARAIWRYWDQIYSVPNWYAAFGPIALAILACAASALTFLALLRATRTNAARIAMVYLSYLLILLIWHAAGIRFDDAQVVVPDSVRVAAVAFQAFCAAWLAFLWYRMWNHSEFR